jgi:hypothetical protein
MPKVNLSKFGNCFVAHPRVSALLGVGDLLYSLSQLLFSSI